uniref:Secreted protein n=1 Tax=Cacopsylla melanoneura TaxID=428564 RepID=A0A8D9E6E5_9HEMI
MQSSPLILALSSSCAIVRCTSLLFLCFMRPNSCSVEGKSYTRAHTKDSVYSAVPVSDPMTVCVEQTAAVEERIFRASIKWNAASRFVILIDGPRSRTIVRH